MHNSVIPFTIPELIGAQQRAAEQLSSFTLVLQEINDGELQSIAADEYAAGPSLPNVQMAGTPPIWSSIHTDFGTVTGDEDIPGNTLRVHNAVGDFFDFTIRTKPVVRSLNEVIRDNPASLKMLIVTAMEDTIRMMRRHAPRSGGSLESREMSLAITNAEQALMWLEKVSVPE